MIDAEPPCSAAPPPDILPKPPDTSQTAALWIVYLQRRREALIMELRALDRALGRPQTIPERTR
jgi:hypothetical protein